jgi:hypothetical protein
LEKSENPRFYGQNKLLFKYLALQPLDSFSHMAACRSPSKNTKKMALPFKQNFTMASYRIGIGRTWFCQKACKICSSLVQKKKLKKMFFSSHKLSKHQTSFWSQGILGVKFHKKIKKSPLFAAHFEHHQSLFELLRN